ncbi:unnamed protein product [Cuscuta europaea]|uniref:Uncharacterized protein n=1 Tax=Cuscuta europaea TaxID=41803 RepID=A0A9P0YKE6_CUSEU|nr:unnamed protein product [Cuscuta europaea]
MGNKTMDMPPHCSRKTKHSHRVTFLMAITTPDFPVCLSCCESQGTRVQATAFQGDIEGIDQRLELHSTYQISNAYVKTIIDLKLCVDDKYPYLWSFKRRTFIKDVKPEGQIDYHHLAQEGITPFAAFFDAYVHDSRISTLFRCP